MIFIILYSFGFFLLLSVTFEIFNKESVLIFRFFGILDTEVLCCYFKEV